MLATLTMFFMRNLLRTRPLSKPWLPLQNYLISRSYKDIAVDDIPAVSPTAIKRALKYHNVAFTDGYTSFITACPVCDKDKTVTSANVSKPNLYINKTTGLLICSSCKASGQWQSYEAYLNKKAKKCKTKDLTKPEMLSEKDVIRSYIERIRDTTVDVNSLSKETFASVLTNFKLPQFCSKTADVIKLRVDKSCDNLYFPLDDAEMETVAYKVVNIASNSHRIDGSKNYSGIHFGKIRSRESAVVVSNLSDYLILLNAKVSLNVICLPNGLANLSQYILPSLERFNKLVLWFGSDVESWDCARNFAKKLGEKRCLFIRPTETQQLPHLAPDQDFKSIINSAQPIWHKSITTFSTLREDVLSNLQNIDKVEGVKWKRFPALNKILKGHRKGELTVITGPTGSGKTTFISEYSLDLAIQGVNTLWGSFEIQNSRLAQIMLQQFAGIPLDEHLSQFDFWADQFEKLPLYFMTFHGQQTIKVVMEAVEHATYVHDIRHIIIDNLQFMMGMSEDVKYDRYWKQDLIVAAFRNFATKMNCHVTLVIHPRKEKDTEDLTTSSIFGGAKASQEADNVLIIQDKRLTSLRGKKYLQVAKNRYSGDLGVMALDFDKNGLSYAPKKKKVPDKSSDDTINDKPVESECT